MGINLTLQEYTVVRGCCVFPGRGHRGGMVLILTDIWSLPSIPPAVSIHSFISVSSTTLPLNFIFIGFKLHFLLNDLKEALKGGQEAKKKEKKKKKTQKIHLLSMIRVL